MAYKNRREIEIDSDGVVSEGAFAPFDWRYLKNDNVETTFASKVGLGGPVDAALDARYLPGISLAVGDPVPGGLAAGTLIVRY